MAFGETREFARGGLFPGMISDRMKTGSRGPLFWDDETMATTFDNLGLQFLYPENWTIVEQRQGEMYSASVTLQSPCTSCWTVHRYPSTCTQQRLVEELVAAMRKEYPELEEEPFVEQLVGEESRGVRIYFYYLDLLVRWCLMPITTKGQVFLFEFQAEDKEFDEMESVFLAISTSVLGNASSSASKTS
jgi:hypothetical protein